MANKKPRRPGKTRSKRPRKPRPSRATMAPEKAAAIRDRNLIPAKPGEVRNPEGKNGHEWRKQLRDFAAAAADDADLLLGVSAGADGDTRFEVLMKSIMRNVVLGREASQKLMFEQLAGRARQHIEIENKDNGPPVTFTLPPNGRDVGHEDEKDDDDLDDIDDAAASPEEPEASPETDPEE